MNIYGVFGCVVKSPFCNFLRHPENYTAVTVISNQCLTASKVGPVKINAKFVLITSCQYLFLVGLG